MYEEFEDMSVNDKLDKIYKLLLYIKRILENSPRGKEGDGEDVEK